MRRGSHNYGSRAGIRGAGIFPFHHLSRRFRSTEAHLTELFPSVARLSLECIGNSDALYHNLDVKRTAMDCESLQQCFPCRVRSEPLRAGALIDRKAISSLFVS